MALVAQDQDQGKGQGAISHITHTRHTGHPPSKGTQGRSLPIPTQNRTHGAFGTYQGTPPPRHPNQGTPPKPPEPDTPATRPNQPKPDTSHKTQANGKKDIRVLRGMQSPFLSVTIVPTILPYPSSSMSVLPYMSHEKMDGKGSGSET